MTQVFEADVEVCGIDIGGLVFMVRGFKVEAETIGCCEAGGE